MVSLQRASGGSSDPRRSDRGQISAGNPDPPAEGNRASGCRRRSQPDRVQADPEGARAGLFEDALHGLVLGEAEFADDESMTRFCRPAHAVAEVTSDPRLTGGQLIRTTRSELVAVLAEYGVAGLAR